MLTPDLDQLVFTAYPLLDATFARALARPEPLDHWVLVVVVALASAFLLLRLGSAVSRRNWKDRLLEQKRESRRRTRQLAHIFASREFTSSPLPATDPADVPMVETFDPRALDVHDRLNRARAEAIHVLMLIDRLLESTRTHDGMMRLDLSDPALNFGETSAVIDNLIKSRRVLRQLHGRQVALRPYDVAVPSPDYSFVERVYEVVNHHLGDAGFTVGQLAREVGVSESRLKRKLRSLVDETPVELIRRTRLERAADLLRSGSGNVSDVAFATGFSNLSYFAKCFRKRWGMTPSQFLAGESSAGRNGGASG